jgi:hypothetical protein
MAKPDKCRLVEIVNSKMLAFIVLKKYSLGPIISSFLR